MSNRDLFSELSSALVESKEHSEGKLTLKTHQKLDRVFYIVNP
ncbi:Antitoxin igA-2 (fragment) [Moritella yayanosii]|uniref:Antitoxin igA-2 n=1 Tax=Moritella yayanosii TaxID=69539 RepID=A0A330LMD9_9GAMM